MSTLLAVVMITAATWPGYSQPRYGGHATAPLHSRPLTLDPVRTERIGEWQAALLLYDGLMRLTQQGRAPVHHLATKVWLGSRNGRLVVVDLRSGVRSHHGHVLTAADVVASLQRLSRAPGGWVVGTVKSLQAVGTTRVRVELHRPTPELTAVLAAPTALITPRGHAPGRRLDGTGPFRYVRGGLGQELQLSAYARHFAGRPFISTLRLVPYRRHRDEIQAFYLSRSLVSFQGTRVFGRTPGFPARRLLSPAITTVSLLTGSSGPVTDRRVRQAIYLAANKLRLRKLVTVAPTRPAHGPVPPVFLGPRARRQARQAAPYSPARARRLLGAAAANPVVAARRDSGGQLALNLLVDRSRHRDLDAARKLMADLSAVGIRVTITPLTAARFAAQCRAGQFDLALTRFTSPVLRARYHLAAGLAAAGQRTEARRLVRARRALLTRRIRDFMRDLPLIPLFHVGVRADVSSSIFYLQQGPWGLFDWAGAHFAGGRPPLRLRHARGLGRLGLWPSMGS
ncbi:MAG: ABC transporter substrate-binding protein [bacterium]